MAVGSANSVANINNTITQLCVQLRNICNQIRMQNTPITNMGLSGLEALGFDAADAATVLAVFSYLSTVSEVYYGTVTQGTTFDFDNELSSYWAGS
jgi:hypothetical protein